MLKHSRSLHLNNFVIKFSFRVGSRLIKYSSKTLEQLTTWIDKIVSTTTYIVRLNESYHSNGVEKTMSQLKSYKPLAFSQNQVLGKKTS